MQALCALPKQQVFSKAMHGHAQQQLIPASNAPWMALTFAPQQQLFAINNTRWLALSITQQDQLIAVNNAQWSALSSHLTDLSGSKIYPHGAPQL